MSETDQDPGTPDGEPAPSGANPGSELHQRLLKRSEPLGFQAIMGLFGAVTIGVGALMGAGLYVLVGLAAGEAGPGAWVAYGACGALTFLTVLTYARLARRLPVSGGGYVYAYRQLGSFWGFIVGWHLAVGSIFACGLYASGFGFYLGSFFPALGTSPWALRAVAANGAMLFTLDGWSLAFGAGILVTGCMVFLGYSYVSEKRGRTELSIRLDEAGRDVPSLLRHGQRILLPVANPATQDSLMRISEAILLPRGGEVVVLSVVQKATGISPREALRALRPDHDAMKVLGRISDSPSHPSVRVRPVIRAAKGLPQGIAHAAREEGCKLIIMGWAS